jgi:ferric-dicitrate binding protein FerR (iron transport regulator)
VYHYVTHAGQRSVVTLASGIGATLAPQTTLSVTESATGSIVTLVGEVFFTVPHDPTRPFVVRTGKVTTRVLGTAFDIRHYAGDSATQVFVTEGKVATGTTRLAVVTTGSLALVTDSSVITTNVSDAGTITGWRDGRLVFQNAPASEVFAVVSRWYGVTVRLLDPSLANKLLTAELNMRNSRSEFLAALETILEVRITTVGDTLLVAPQHVNPRRAIGRRDAGALFTPRTEMGR